MAACSAAVSPLWVWVCNEAPGRKQAGALRALSEWIARSSRKSFTLPRAAAKLCTASRESRCRKWSRTAQALGDATPPCAHTHHTHDLAQQQPSGDLGYHRRLQTRQPRTRHNNNTPDSATAVAAPVPGAASV